MHMTGSFGVIFDMDGVLVDSNPTHVTALRRFFREHNQNISEEFLVTRVFGRTNKEWIADVFGSLPEETVSELAGEKEKLFREIFDPNEAIVPGLAGFLDMLKSKGIKLAVATSAPLENAEFILTKLSVKDHFNVVLDSSHVNMGKPEPDIYLKAAKALGSPPGRCIVFEDSLAGVKSAKRAGNKIIGLTTTHNPEELSDCDMVIDNFNDLTFEELAGLFDG